MTTMEIDVKRGDWRTVYQQWGSGAKTHGVFTRPAGMQIKVRYGVGWLGRDRQKQLLDGVDPKRLEIGGATTYLRARFQVKAQADTHLIWELLREGP